MREMYDLCRKYKYFYKKRGDLEKFHRKYHDVDLSGDIKKTNISLTSIEREMMVQLLKRMDVDCSHLETENAYSDMYSSFYNPQRVPVCLGSTTNIELRNSQEFIHSLVDYLVRYKQTPYNRGF